jgi:tryptophan-rich sensory protein
MKSIRLDLIGWIVAFQIVSAMIGYFTQGSVDGWYQTLNRPPLTPPNLVFPVMWTILYALIAASGWCLWQRRSTAAGMMRFRLFCAYMFINWTWSFVFFTAQMMLAGFVWILVLNAIAAWIVLSAWRDHRIVSWLMLPPLLWTTFAAYLNGAYWWLN